jgi:hypothetical protein
VLETAADISVALCSLDDDPSMPIHTFRMWFIGLGLAVFGAVLGMLFEFRPQVISVSALFLQLIAFMLGKIFEQVIPGPGSRFHDGGRLWTFLNPGRFSKLGVGTGNYSDSSHLPDIKEHVAAQIMANTASSVAIACAVFASDDLFYGITVNVCVPLTS